ncbi:MAG: NFACT family protein [Caldilineaceae bacterium]|nr:NFACT family protein [Caldilineaceae bacterium]
MHFDALTLAAVVDELRRALSNGRVQQVLLPDERSIGLEIYADRQRHYLLLSAHPQASRIHLMEQKLRRGVEKETPMLLLLRKYVRGALLDRVEQPIPYERVLNLHFDHPDHGISTLAIEPMGRLSNIFLLDAGGKIRGVLIPVPPGDNAERVLLPKRPYTFPPPQDKVPPLDDGSSNYDERLKLALQGDPKLWKALMAGVAGISPTLAREIAWRASEDEDANGADVDLLAVIASMQSLWHLPNTGEWQPGVALDDEGDIVGYAPYELHFLGDFAPTETISAAIAEFYGEKKRDAAGGKDPYANMRNNVAALLKDALSRIDRQLAALTEDEPAPGEPALVRTQAEWLMALSSQIAPGQRQLIVPLDEETLTIRLDERLSPIEQAERLFDRAAKMERAAEIIPVRRAELEADRAFVMQLQSDLALAENQPEIASVREELRGAGYLRVRPKRHQRAAPDRSQPMRFLSPDGFTILVGRNARQNEIVTFNEANAEDLWLHIRDLPGAHVVIRNGGQNVSAETVEAAARLAAYFSSQRGERAVPVAITQRRFVTRMPGGHPGQVHFRNEETITVAGTMPEL